MTSSNRPTDVAPGGMHGATRMHDPSEAAHDRVRRHIMNITFIVLVFANFLQWNWVAPVRGWDWLSVAVYMIAAAPLGLAVKMFELRFKMARDERQRALREVPTRKQAELALYSLLFVVALVLRLERWTWALVGIWAYDFVTYYHDRPERMRHLYAVTKTLDELRAFPAPWAWTLPALGCEVLRRYLVK